MGQMMSSVVRVVRVVRLDDDPSFAPVCSVSFPFKFGSPIHPHPVRNQPPVHPPFLFFLSPARRTTTGGDISARSPSTPRPEHAPIFNRAYSSPRAFVSFVSSIRSQSVVRVFFLAVLTFPCSSATSTTPSHAKVTRASSHKLTRLG